MNLIKKYFHVWPYALISFVVISSLVSFTFFQKTTQGTEIASKSQGDGEESSAVLKTLEYYYLEAHPDSEEESGAAAVVADAAGPDSSSAAEAKDEVAKEYSHKIIAANVNLRSDANTSSEVVTKLNANDRIILVSRSGDWDRVETDKGVSGWVKNEFVADKDAKIYSHKIIAANVNLRSDANTSSDVVTKLNENDRIILVSRSGDWDRVETDKGVSGWVKNEFVADKNAVIKKVVPLGQQVVAYSKKFLGVKYVWGGTSPKGFDCSGLMKYAYKQYGITLNRVAADQAKQGKKVTRDQLKAGDLVFFDTNGGHNYINHVGMYVGNGMFIHASSGSRSGKRVVVSSLGDSFYSKAFMTARRVTE